MRARRSQCVRQRVIRVWRKSRFKRSIKSRNHARFSGVSARVVAIDADFVLPDAADGLSLE